MKVELGSGEMGREVFLDRLLKGLHEERDTLALSKQYSQPNTTKMAMTTTR